MFGRHPQPSPSALRSGEGADCSDSAEPELQYAAASHDVLPSLEFACGTRRGSSFRLPVRHLRLNLISEIGTEPSQWRDMADQLKRLERSPVYLTIRDRQGG